MKRILNILIAFLLIISFLGCSNVEKEKRDFDATRSFAHYYSEVRAAETADTIYFVRWNEKFIKYVNKDTGISGVLCGKPECRHNDSDCNAYVNAQCLMINEDRLYWVAIEFVKCFVYSMALDGTDRRVEAELPPEFFPSTTVAYGHYIFDNGHLYFSNISEEIVDGEPVLYNYVVAFPVKSRGAPFVILKEQVQNSGYSNLSIQLYKEKLYILTDEKSALTENSDEFYHLQLRRWDNERTELETLYENSRSLIYWTSELWVTDDGIVFNGNTSRALDDSLENGIYKYCFESKDCVHLFDNGVYGWANMGVIADNLITGYQMLDNNAGIYDFKVILKDFEGNVMVDEIYQLDLRDVFAGYNKYQTSFLGRDEKYAYYTFFATDNSSNGNGSNQDMTYVTIISVALDGSGAKAMCTQMEQHVYL